MAEDYQQISGPGKPLEVLMREIVMVPMINRECFLATLVEDDYLAVRLHDGNFSVIPMENLFKNHGFYKN